MAINILRYFSALILMVSLTSLAYGADVKISELPTIISIDGTEVIPLVHEGVTKKTSITSLADTHSHTATTLPANSPTASALLANGSNCASGSFPLGVDDAGNVEYCTSIGTAAYQNVGTLTDTKYCIFTTGTGIVCDSDGGSVMTWPNAGIPVSTGADSWGTSLSTDGEDDCASGYVCTGGHTHTAYQATDADLTAIAALSCNQNEIIKKGASAWECGTDNNTGGGSEYAWKGTYLAGTTYAINDIVMVAVANGDGWDYDYYISKTAGESGNTPPSRADDAHWYYKGSSTRGAAGTSGSQALTVTHHTSGATITCENNDIHTNLGATGTVKLRINALTKDSACRFKVLAAYSLQIEPYVGTDHLVDVTDSAGKGTASATLYAQIDLVSYADTKAIPMNGSGVWTQYTP